MRMERSRLYVADMSAQSARSHSDSPNGTADGLHLPADLGENLRGAHVPAQEPSERGGFVQERYTREREVNHKPRYIGDDYMDLPPRRRHSLERTSPKGQSFVGTCTLCGIPNLTLSDMNSECENVRGLSDAEALVEAVTGKQT